MFKIYLIYAFATIATVIIIGLPAWGLLKLNDYQRSRSNEALDKIFLEFRVAQEPTPEYVEIVFHTYRGIVAWVEQSEHRLYVFENQAEPLLRKLHKHNLKFGICAYGALFIPLVSYMSLRKQLRIVRKRKKKLNPSEGRWKWLI